MASVVQVASKALATNTFSYTVSLTGVGPGNPLLLCSGAQGFTNAFFLTSVTAPGYTWTKVVSIADSANNSTVEIWIGTGGAGGSVTVTATGTGTGTPSSGGYVLELSGVSVSGLVTGTAVGATSTTCTSANLSGGAGDLIVHMMNSASTATTALPGAPWTNSQGANNTTCLSYEIGTAAPGAAVCRLSGSGTSWSYAGVVIPAVVTQTLTGVSGLNVANPFSGPPSSYGVLRYWDVTQGAYVSLPGVTGPPGTQGPQGVAGTVPTDDPFGRITGVRIGSIPVAGTTLKLWAQSYVVTTTAFGTANLSVSFNTGYVAMAVMADATPYNQLGITINGVNCTLTYVQVMVWHGSTIQASAQVRMNLIALGA